MKGPILWALFWAFIFMLLTVFGAWVKGIDFIRGNQLFQVYLWALFAWFGGVAFGLFLFMFYEDVRNSK